MRPKNLYIALCTLALWPGTQISAQSPTDSVNTDPGIHAKATETHLYRPQIQAGIGALSYFGDVGNLDGTGRVTTPNWGYSLAVKNRISNSFGLDIFAMFGKVSSQEQLDMRDANFESSITMGGLSVNYNFDALLPKERTITPYISLGISTFEFNPKGDKYDANGNQYHFWDDGTIRNAPQSEAKSNDANIMQRDDVYETDLREANSDSYERYPLRALSIPIGAGADIKVTESFSISMGSTFHYTFTDNLDNLNSEDNVWTNTKKGNDLLLFTSVGIAYDLNYRKKTTSPSGLRNNDFPELEYEDEDNDGIADMIDLCPFTPASAEIDMYGCPVDKDKDGVPDYADLEPQSAPGAAVNSDGVTLTEEELENMYLAYMDSTGNLHVDKSQFYTANIKGLKHSKRDKGFRIEFNDTDEMSASEIAKLLSIADIKAEMTRAGTVYYLGEYKTMAAAVARQIATNESGIASKIAYYEYGEKQHLPEEVTQLLAKSVDAVELDKTAVIFRVQIGAYRYKLSENIFADVPNLFVIEGDDGLTRYVSGSFTNIKDAAEHKINLLLDGYEGSFVTAYQNGKRITLRAAGATVTGKENINSSAESGHINKKFVKFTVQVGSFNGRVPADILSDYMTLGNIRPMRESNGSTKYVYGSFETLSEANAARNSILTQGFEDAFVVGEFNGQVITAEEAEKIKSN